MKKYGFGMMRLPLLDENNPASVDYQQVKEMVDMYLERGYNYFDTAYPYHNGASENAFKKAVSERYPRDDYIIANKLPIFAISTREEMEKVFDEQLERCGVEYFDYYMLHNWSTWTKKTVKNIDAVNFLRSKKEEGKIKHIGFSFHDKPKLLKKFLEQFPDTDFVQLQINYMDWDSESVASRECYNMVTDLGIDVIAMEPVRGGALANVPPSVENLFKKYDENSKPVQWALKFCAGLENCFMVLSGASNLEQMEDNLNTFDNMNELSLQEAFMIGEASSLIAHSMAVPCTSCNYCINECSNNIPIPTYLNIYNDAHTEGTDSFNAPSYYTNIQLSGDYGLASDCDGCGDCVKQCPQHIKIPKLMEKIAEEFEN